MQKKKQIEQKDRPNDSTITIFDVDEGEEPENNLFHQTIITNSRLYKRKNEELEERYKI